MARGKQGPEDWLETGFRVVRESLGEHPRTTPAPADAPGRAGGLKGGAARAAKLTAEERQAIGRKAAAARWHASAGAVTMEDASPVPPPADAQPPYLTAALFCNPTFDDAGKPVSRGDVANSVQLDSPESTPTQFDATLFVELVPEMYAGEFCIGAFWECPGEPLRTVFTKRLELPLGGELARSYYLPLKLIVSGSGIHWLHLKFGTTVVDGRVTDERLITKLPMRVILNSPS